MMMKILLATLLIYALSLVLTAVGSRLAGRCTTWCCALLGLPMWVVGGTVTPLCLALPQLVLAFLAAGMSVTALAVGTALAGAVTNLGLALAVCLFSRRRYAVADRDELCRKAVLLLAACGVLAVFVRDGELSYTGTGLLMGLFVLFVLTSIVFQHRFTYGETIEVLSTSEETPRRRLDAQRYGYTAHTMAFPVMSVWNALKNLAGVLGGLALLFSGARTARGLMPFGAAYLSAAGHPLPAAAGAFAGYIAGGDSYQGKIITTGEGQSASTTDETAGGYAKATGGKNINFMIIHKPAVIQFEKHVAPKIITPEQNQSADGYKFGYRNVGIADVYENKVAGIYLHFAAT